MVSLCSPFCPIFILIFILLSIIYTDLFSYWRNTLHVSHLFFTFHISFLYNFIEPNFLDFINLEYNRNNFCVYLKLNYILNIIYEQFNLLKSYTSNIIQYWTEKSSYGETIRRTHNMICLHALSHIQYDLPHMLYCIVFKIYIFSKLLDIKITLKNLHLQ